MAATAGGGPIMEERAAASTMGVPAYALLQSITRRKKKKKEKRNGRGNEKIGSRVKAAKRNQNSERGLLLAIIVFLW